MVRRAGQRRHRIDLQSLTSRTAAGTGYVEVWDTYATVWASVMSSQAWSSERPVANTQDLSITHLVELDYRSDVRGKHRVLFGDRPLYIRGLENVEERNKTWRLACEERTT